MSLTVGVKFWEKVDPCLLADPFVVSGLVQTELSAVESVRVTSRHSALNEWGQDM